MTQSTSLIIYPGRFRNGRRPLHKLLRNLVHQLVGGITDVGRTKFRAQLGHHHQITRLAAFSSHRHCNSDFREGLRNSLRPDRQP